jgi:hypothetical protein
MATTQAAPEAKESPVFAADGRRLAMLWLTACVALAGVVVVAGRFGPLDGLIHMNFAHQDLPAAVLGWGLLLAGGALAARFSGAAERAVPSGPRAVALLAAAAAAIAYAGAHLVFERHPLSMDEYMAVFDAAVFRTGRPAAEVAPEWRAYVPALQPLFRLEAPGHAWWASAYLPVNAATRALFDRLGDGALAGPFWAGLSVLMVYAVGRRLRPERPEYALAAAALLATSAQVLITAMTPFAMSAHLALNLLWLWLLLRGGAVGHLGAMGVAFAATGLHQLVFHPLFAAPFVLRLWLQRRWAPAAAHTAAYLAIGLFWTAYWRLALPTPPALAGATPGGVLEHGLALILTFNPVDVTEMGANLFRFTVWQNPLVIPLLLLAAAGMRRRREGVELALWGGLILTVAAMALILPYQGNGWGYRYLHGLVGSACLLAAAGWLEAVDAVAEPVRRRAWGLFVLVGLGSALVLLPLRAWQAKSFVSPYAAASRAIARTDADVVLVDDRGAWFGSDLVRNDPFLRNRPVVMHLTALKPEQVLELCRTRKVVMFDALDARRFGVRTDHDAKSAPACPPVTAAAARAPVDWRRGLRRAAS